MTQQTFVAGSEGAWLNLEAFPGTQLLSLAVPVPEGSIHRLRMENSHRCPFLLPDTKSPLHTSS
ncbi:MAG: hypothetical protein AAF171_27975 [Cyanobacteria bacterium P01_A01_bin.116]